jgi:hypothetical protein
VTLYEVLAVSGAGYVLGLLTGAWYERKWWLRNLRQHNVQGRWVREILEDEKVW